ncbi:MAG: glycosyltransferase family 2 protein [Bdellovibrionales bacterium]|nr:glycosyltransferase family 2 protein [Bdellovibrionales bacterium]
MQVAVIIPCYNEEITIAKVVQDARAALPQSQIFVFDNNSTDRTKERAHKAGATVVFSPLRGKGNVIRHAFRVVDADVYVMIDGDDTYPVDQAPMMIETLRAGGYDMAVGTRLKTFAPGAFRRFHLFGNHLLSQIVSSFFHQKITDMLSGFRVFSKDFVAQVPLHSQAFEIETELTLQALSKNYSVVEIPITYRERPDGSESKLQTFGDGFLILSFIFRLMKDYRPLHFFFFISLFCVGLSLVAGWAPIMDYVHTGFVSTVPRAILAASLMILSAVFVGVGLILDSQRRYHNDQFLMMQKILQHKEKMPNAKRRFPAA